ncbi:MAG: phosphatidylinositol-specific phospholipase C1-like protein [Proteobacteria bacterium]|nr:phosphatidylinositol-specific phospholipase C1-like protein [Pseudomonadota bacterium]
MNGRLPALLLFALCANGCDRAPVSATPAPSLHDLRVLGSHNSYKRALPGALLHFVAADDPGRARAIDYSHDSLESQLDSGLRQLEIDVLADPEGGRFSTPFARRWLARHGQDIGVRDGFDHRALSSPGLKVLHIPDIDVFTHCATFVLCLQSIRRWSDENPGHLPLFVLINVKESGAAIDGAVQPIVFGSAEYDALDREILSVWPRERLIVPADVVRPGKSLRDSVLEHGWPSIDASRDKLVFVFDGNARQSDAYRGNRPSLGNRIMFAAVDESKDEAAILVINDPVGEQARIRTLVDRGFIVRTRADADFDETPAEMKTRFRAAVSSGAQIVSSDFYAGSPNSERAGYAVDSFRGERK